MNVLTSEATLGGLRLPASPSSQQGTSAMDIFLQVVEMEAAVMEEALEESKKRTLKATGVMSAAQRYSQPDALGWFVPPLRLAAGLPPDPDSEGRQVGATKLPPSPAYLDDSRRTLPTGPTHPTHRHHRPGTPEWTAGVGLPEMPRSWRARKNHNPKAIAILRAWLYQNMHRPYPSSEDKRELARVAHLTEAQVAHWFNNARKREKLGRSQSSGLRRFADASC
jgi:hypothetical protein